jgi:hypothetical protein
LIERRQGGDALPVNEELTRCSPWVMRRNGAVNLSAVSWATFAGGHATPTASGFIAD